MKTVLLVEDDPGSRDGLARLLRRDGWEVLEAEDGEMGIRLALDHRPQLVVCDLLMPRCNGFQVCRAVRQHLQPTRIIVTSARDYPIDRLNAEEAGANHYLVKPFQWEELRDLIKDLAEPPVPAGPADEASKAASGSSAGGRGEEGAAAPSVLIRFWGVRGSIPTPGADTVYYGGNTSCVEVRADGEIIVLDAGTGLRPLGQALAAEFHDRPLRATLLISHTHWDHIQGLPFFAPAYDPKNQLRVLGYEGARDGLATVLSGQMESPYFPINLKQMPGNILIEELRDLEFAIGPVKVRAKFVNHPGVCVGYRLETSAGVIAYLPDNEPVHRQRQEQQTPPSAAASASPDGKASTLEFARNEDAKLIEFIRDADVLVIDSQYDCDEYAAHVGWGHGCVDDVVTLALQAGVRQLFLFHHDPTHTDAKVREMAAHAREIVAASPDSGRLVVNAAREGLSFDLRPDRRQHNPQAAAAGAGSPQG